MYVVVSYMRRRDVTEELLIVYHSVTAYGRLSSSYSRGDGTWCLRIARNRLDLDDRRAGTVFTSAELGSSVARP